MTASPEISRINGARSRGPKTARGKLISSLNATKHGLYSQRPPLLLSENLTTFQEILQALIDEYQPQGATQHLLIQQIAMCWLRLYRVWNAEAAIANQAVLQQQRINQYPPRRHGEDLLEVSDGNKTGFHPDTLTAERELIQYLLSETESFTSALPRRNPRQWENLSELIGLFKNSLEKVIGEYPGKQVPLTPEFSTEATFTKERRRIEAVEEQAGSLWWTIYELKERWLCFRNVETYRQKCQELISACSERLMNIDKILKDIAKLEQSESETMFKTLAIPEGCERLNRYERHLTKLMHDALDRLNQMKKQRQNAPSTGSFCQNCILMEES